LIPGTRQKFAISPLGVIDEQIGFGVFDRAKMKAFGLARESAYDDRNAYPAQPRADPVRESRRIISRRMPPTAHGTPISLTFTARMISQQYVLDGDHSQRSSEQSVPFTRRHLVEK